MPAPNEDEPNEYGCIIMAVIAIVLFLIVTLVFAPYDPSTRNEYRPGDEVDPYRIP